MTARTILSALVAAALTTAPQAAHGSGASASEPTRLGEPVLEITVDSALPDADAIHKNLREEGDQRLERAQIDPVSDPATPARIAVSVGGVAYEYTVHVEASQNGEPVGAQSDTTCECSKSDLVLAVLDEVEARAQRLALARAAAPDPAAPPVSGMPPGPGVKRPLAPLGAAGIGVMVLGVAGLATGLGLVGVGEKNSKKAGDASMTERSDLRPAGLAVIGIGGALLLGGALMLSIERFKARRGGRARVVPVGGPGFAGLTLHSRF